MNVAVSQNDRARVLQRNLIDKLEIAPRSDRRLDVEIGCLVSGLSSTHFDKALDLIGKVGGDGWRPSEEEWPRYTESIDAALKLVPAGWSWRISLEGQSPDGTPGKFFAQIAEPILTNFGYGVGVRAQSVGATAAIALCIVSLKAGLRTKSDG